MGCSGPKPNQNMQSCFAINVMLDALENDLNDLSSNLSDLEKEEFEDIEHMNALAIKQQIDEKQMTINERLKFVRDEFINIGTPTNEETFRINEIRLNFVSNRAQSLYDKEANIIKQKIDLNK